MIGPSVMRGRDVASCASDLLDIAVGKLALRILLRRLRRARYPSRWKLTIRASARAMLLDSGGTSNFDRIVMLLALSLLRSEIDAAGYPGRWVRKIREVVDAMLNDKAAFQKPAGG